MSSHRGTLQWLVLVLGTVYFVLGTPYAQGHPLLFKFYERTVQVRLSPTASGEIVVDVKYDLELNQLIALLDAKVLLEQRKEEEPGNAKAYYEAFGRVHAPILADRIYATLDNQSLGFTCVQRDYKLTALDGTIHCSFLFRGTAKPQAAGQHVFTFEEGAYKEEPGRVLLSLHADPSLTVLKIDEPSAELKDLKPADLKIGDDERMRHATANFTIPAPTPTDPEMIPPPKLMGGTPADLQATSEESTEPDASQLLDLLFDTSKGLAFLLVIAAGFGAFHALTPGHGKTLVAAYLVGERGTILHALFLGLVTTLTHTGAVLLLAAVLAVFGWEVGGVLQFALGFGGGLLIVGMGFWLLYRRMAGQSDHFHLDGGHHHHHHDHDHSGHDGDHYHDRHGYSHDIMASGRVSWWNLLVLGVVGGMVPCTDAIFMLFFAMSTGHLRLALPLLLAFSAGLAGVLITVGMLVVTSKRFAVSQFGESRLFRALPLISALLVTCAGLWLCYNAIHNAAVPTASRAETSVRR